MKELDSKTTKQLLAAGLAIIVVLAIIGGAVYYQKNHSTKNQQAALTPKEEAVKLYGDKNYDAAVNQVNDLISKAPADSDNYNFKANILRDKGDVAGASENYNKAIELNPHVLAPYVNAANMYINQGDKKSANMIIDKGLKEFPDQKALVQLQEEAK